MNRCISFVADDTATFATGQTADLDRLGIVMTIRLLRQYIAANRRLTVEEMRAVAKTLENVHLAGADNVA